MKALVPEENALRVLLIEAAIFAMDPAQDNVQLKMCNVEMVDWVIGLLLPPVGKLALQ